MPVFTDGPHTQSWWLNIADALRGFDCAHCKATGSANGEYWTDMRGHRAVVLHCWTCGGHEYIVTQPGLLPVWHRPDLQGAMA